MGEFPKVLHKVTKNADGSESRAPIAATTPEEQKKLEADGYQDFTFKPPPAKPAAKEK